MFKNWKTTLSGLVAALPFILRLFGVHVPDDITNALLGGGITSFGLTAKDKDVTGGTR